MNDERELPPGIATMYLSSPDNNTGMRKYGGSRDGLFMDLADLAANSKMLLIMSSTRWCSLQATLGDMVRLLYLCFGAAREDDHHLGEA